MVDWVLAWLVQINHFMYLAMVLGSTRLAVFNIECSYMGRESQCSRTGNIRVVRRSRDESQAQRKRKRTISDRSS